MRRERSNWRATNTKRPQPRLKQVQRGNLSESDQKKFEEALSKAQTGADGRVAARSEYDAGETSLAAGNLGDALGHYHAAASNSYGDTGTHQKALEKIALVESQRKADAAADAHLYDEAAADYKAGHYDTAQTKFEKLKANDYRVHMFQWSPEEYLQHIHAKMAAAAPKPAPAPMAAPATSAEAPAAPVVETPAPAPKPHERTAREYYDLGRHEYKTGDWIAARRDLTKAQEAGYHAGMFQETPAKMLAAIDNKESADEEREMTAAERRRAHAQQLASAQAAPNRPNRNRPRHHRARHCAFRDGHTAPDGQRAGNSRSRFRSGRISSTCAVSSRRAARRPDGDNGGACPSPRHRSGCH